MSAHRDIRATSCPGAQTPLLSGDLDDLLSREWLITNGLGGYASSTVVNCNTRRYHGLLVSATMPPVGRVVMVSNVLDRVFIDGMEFPLSSFEFNGAIHPDGFRYQTSFHRQIEDDLQSVSSVYQWNNVTAIRTLWLFSGHNTALMYWLVAVVSGAGELRLEVQPLLAMRDFHSLRRQSAGNVFDARRREESLHVQVPVFTDRFADSHHRLHMHPTGLRGPVNARFCANPDWWYNFRYRVEARRGQDCGEDLYTPGYYQVGGRNRIGFGLWLDGDGLTGGELDGLLSRVNSHLQSDHGALSLIDDVSSPLTATVTSETDNPLHEAVEVTLRKAAGQFVVRRRDGRDRDGWTILAGYPWFGDWGRDAFQSLSGLLLSTGRYEQAREVLRVFGEAQSDGLIPNRFGDYNGQPDYNSVDASLWYVYAMDQYLRATNDSDSWTRFGQRVCRNVVDSFLSGTHYQIKADADDGLLWAGSDQTQITWMDGRCGDVTFTSRWGKPVEINALWYNALRICSARLADTKKQTSKKYGALADQVGVSFQEKFWYPEGRYLFDCIRDDFADTAIRPNQIFAVSLQASPLRIDQQRAVVQCVRDHLLTPYGLRSLAPGDPAYQGVCAGDQYQRDSAYHQGTVWAFLIGPFIEAYLRVEGNSATAATAAQGCLKPLLDHLYEAGIGTISEIFDGDPPHAPRGTIAQAWSVAQVIEAQLRITGILKQPLSAVDRTEPVAKGNVQ